MARCAALPADSILVAKGGLVGGGTDVLDGGAGDDIVIGGAITYFNETTGAVNKGALDAIMQEWTQTDLSYARPTTDLIDSGEYLMRRTRRSFFAAPFTILSNLGISKTRRRNDK